jgi:histone acetyltransferase (RNA polymerase elongator complex component)
MTCLSKHIENTTDDIDIENLYNQTNHLDPRRTTKNVQGDDLKWKPLKQFITELVWGEKIEDSNQFWTRFEVLFKANKRQYPNIHDEDRLIEKPSTVALNYVYKCIIQEALMNGTPEKFPRMPHIEKFMRGKAPRFTSGVLVFTVLTSGIRGFKGGRGGCQWNCHYCPNEPDMPRSYLKKEPAVARAAANDFDAFRQIWDRASVLFLQGKHIDKIEIIVEGGTIASYDKMYLRKFMRDLYYAFNTFYQPNEVRRQERYVLEKEMKINETALCKVIGLTLETRPDCINEDEIKFFREVGCTRVQLGIQHLSNKILKKVNRGCYYIHAVDAIKMLKDCGFKVDAHWMPDLPGSNPTLDKKMFQEILDSQHVQVDDWKIYPCQTVDYSKILDDFNHTMTTFKEYLIVLGHSDIKFKQSETLIQLKSVFKEFCNINGIDHVINDIICHCTWEKAKSYGLLTFDTFMELVQWHNAEVGTEYHSCQTSPIDMFIIDFINLLSEIEEFEEQEAEFTDKCLNPIDEYDEDAEYQHLIKPRFHPDMSPKDRLDEMVRYCTTWEKKYSKFVPYLHFHDEEIGDMMQLIKTEYLKRNPDVEPIQCPHSHYDLMSSFYTYLIDIGFQFHSVFIKKTRKEHHRDKDDVSKKDEGFNEYGQLTNNEVEKLFNEFCWETQVDHYKPYTHDFVPTKDLETSNLLKLIDVCKSVKRKIWPWIRINRLVRDIPHNYIRAGLERADLRKVIEKQLNDEGTPCRCIRCSEIKDQDPAEAHNISIKIRVYEASDGIEYFISLEDNEHNLYGFTRLRLCYNPGLGFIPELEGSALIRELHVYGEMIPAWDKHLIGDVVQHRGFGKRLVREAERIARFHGYNKMAIIAGNGVRNYYINKLGYQLEGTYVTKDLVYAYCKSETHTLLEWKNQQWHYATLQGSPIYIKPKDVEPTSLMTHSQYLYHVTINNPMVSTIIIGTMSIMMKKYYEYLMEENQT